MPFPQIRRFKALILQRFQARLTLFSKYFAPFPHGTCSLSDSRRYWASRGIYHAICAVVPNNATLRDRPYVLNYTWWTGFSPFITLFSNRPSRTSILVMPQNITIQCQGTGFRYELFPLHSPLLRKSLVVFIPPLTYMLKFSGWSSLRSGLI